MKCVEINRCQEHRDTSCWHLTVDGMIQIAHETYAVCDQVCEAMHGHRAGVTGECLEVADVLIEKYGQESFLA